MQFCSTRALPAALSISAPELKAVQAAVATPLGASDTVVSHWVRSGDIQLRSCDAVCDI